MLTRIIFAIAFVVGLHSVAEAQDSKKPLSPKDSVITKVDGVNLKIVYCRPSSRGRKMLGGNESYGEVWRTGANAATTFTINKSLKVEGQALPAGKYELFTIPGEKEWTIIFQSFQNQWGAFSYKKENDVLRVKVKATKPATFVETFTIEAASNKVILKWENALVAFGVKG